MRKAKFFSKIFVVINIIVLIIGCNSSSVEVGTPQPTQTLPPVDIRTTGVPGAEEAATRFLASWQAENYDVMYEMLTAYSKENVDKDTFVQRYKDMANEISLSNLEYEIHSQSVSPKSATVLFKVIINSTLFDSIPRENQMELVMEKGEWRIDWHDGLILPEMAGGNYLSMDPQTPVRASIFDKNGNPLAVQNEAVAIGVWPDYVDLKEDNGLLSLLSVLTDYKSYTIVGLIENADTGAYLALGEVPADLDPRRLDLLSTYGAAVTSNYSSRLYLKGGIAPHVVGYVSAIQEDEMDEYRRLGYRADERVGRKGLELWGEEILGGERGGSLYLFNPEGKPISAIAEAPSSPGENVYTTIESEFQYEAQKAMSVFSGAIVVLERDTGKVLAMVSSPDFNPNAFEIENYNWNTLLSEILNNPDSPQFNRATEGQYPLGSVFKIITMAAALESGRYTPETTYDCEYVFDELPNFPRYDWTWDHFQEDGYTKPSGNLTLPEGLMRSCNPYFWHIGLDLYRVGLPTAISDMAKGFGLGSPTGIEGLAEESGNIPEPQNDVDAINLAIGQGDMSVTPLQVAQFIAAIGNGGTIYKPQVIQAISEPGTGITSTIEAEFVGILPVAPDNLKVIREAMEGVVRSTNPEGTAFVPFRGLEINVAGKTGTATSSGLEPHAWFAGYTFEERPDRPDIAAVVIAENAGEGSEVAAPIFRRIVELYFYGKPLKLYRWEANFDVTRSPTPIITDTPTAQPDVNP
jgi:penicillin-binding protein 2